AALDVEVAGVHDGAPVSPPSAGPGPLLAGLVLGTLGDARGDEALDLALHGGLGLDEDGP
ncbi:hypothetical protein THAOC_07446, partial [Thalassiosira oceanica]